MIAIELAREDLVIGEGQFSAQDPQPTTIVESKRYIREHPEVVPAGAARLAAARRKYLLDIM